MTTDKRDTEPVTTDKRDTEPVTTDKRDTEPVTTDKRDTEPATQTAGPVTTIRAQLGRVREEPTLHWIALVVAIGVGLVLSTVHWLGLVAGGALVGLVAVSLRRALVAGLGFGVLVVLVWSVLFALSGSLGKVMAMGEIAWLGVAIALVAPMVGSLVRGVVG